MPSIQFTSNLKRFYPQLSEVSTLSTRIPNILNELDIQFPGIKSYIVDEKNQLREHVNIFIGEELADRNNVMDLLLSEDDDVYIMQALSGG